MNIQTTKYSDHYVLEKLKEPLSYINQEFIVVT
jgi:hypothetical protein